MPCLRRPKCNEPMTPSFRVPEGGPGNLACAGGQECSLACAESRKVWHWQSGRAYGTLASKKRRKGSDERNAGTWQPAGVGVCRVTRVGVLEPLAGSTCTGDEERDFYRGGITNQAEITASFPTVVSPRDRRLLSVCETTTVATTAQSVLSAPACPTPQRSSLRKGAPPGEPR